MMNFHILKKGESKVVQKSDVSSKKRAGIKIMSKLYLCGLDKKGSHLFQHLVLLLGINQRI